MTIKRLSIPRDGRLREFRRNMFILARQTPVPGMCRRIGVPYYNTRRPTDRRRTEIEIILIMTHELFVR